MFCDKEYSNRIINLFNQDVIILNFAGGLCNMAHSCVTSVYLI